MSPFTLEIIGAVVRWALTGLGMYLVQHHVLNETQSTALVERAGSHLVLAAPMVLALLWSLWSKVRARVKLNTALTLPAGSSEDQVKRVIANGGGAGVAAVVVCLAAVLGTGMLVSSCAPKTWQPATQAAFNKDGLVKTLGALQHSAIAFAENTPPVIPLEDAKLVVDGVQTILDAADAAGTGLPGTVRAVLDSLTVGRPAAGIPPKLRNATIIKLQPFLGPVRDELAKWGE